MFNFEQDYWDKRYKEGGNSGYGSYNKQLLMKLRWLTGLENVSSITEIGCGDFHFGKSILDNLYPTASYIGQDISSVIIKKNNVDFPKYSFTTAIDEIPPADLVLCVDVLLHIIEDSEVEALLKQVESKFTKYLAITGYERDEKMSGHVRIRKFDYKRFGEPIIREIVEEDGEMYFYLFKKDSSAELHTPDPLGPMIYGKSEKATINLSKVSCCLITKEATYPKEVLDNTIKYNFGEVLILTNSDSPYNKYKLFDQAQFNTIYYQDDDAIVPIDKLLDKCEPGILNIGMKPGHIDAYAQHKMTMGLGWGSFFQKDILKSLKKYTDKYGVDEVFKRETERILTALNYPQNRIALDIVDLPSAWADDRLWKQPGHHESALLAQERCSTLV